MSQQVEPGATTPRAAVPAGATPAAAPGVASADLPALAARLFLRSHHAWSLVLAFCDATYTGVWLGLLSRRALHALDEEVYRRWPEYVTDEHNLQGLFDWEEKAYTAFLAGRRRILVLAAGGGREAIALAARGHDVAAYECHPDLREAGRALLSRVAPSVSLQPQERDRAPTGVEADAVVVGWGAYMLTPGRETRIELLRDLARLLPPGGPIILSFFTRPEGGRRLRWQARVANAVRWLRRGRRVEEGDTLGPNWKHRFTRAEIEGEIRAAGLVPASFAERGEGRTASAWAAALRPQSG